MSAVSAPGLQRGPHAPPVLGDDLVLVPRSRRPTQLEDATLRAILDRDVPAVGGAGRRAPEASIVVVTRDNLPFLRLSLESCLEAAHSCELIVVDNGSSDETPGYLAALAERNPAVRVMRNDGNRGFAAGCNQGAAEARAELLVLLNDDVVLSGAWLDRLAAYLDEPRTGMVGPVTNRIGNEAQIDTDYRTLGELRRFVEALARERSGEAFEIPTLTMFCVAMRRSLYREVGPLDERFGTGLLEDDDYSRRVREAGYRLMCAADAFVHHFGETSFGKLVPSGEYAHLLEANQARFKRKWGEPWRPYGRRQSDAYIELSTRMRRTIVDAVPLGGTVLVVSRGDEELLRVAGRHARHFPCESDGTYAGRNPADSQEAVSWLDEERLAGADYLVFPATALWWLEHYGELRDLLYDRHECIHSDPKTCMIFDVGGG